MDSLIMSKIAALQLSVKGLRIEVEAWRLHTSTTGDFMIWEIDALIKEVNALTDSIK